MMNNSFGCALLVISVLQMAYGHVHLTLKGTHHLTLYADFTALGGIRLWFDGTDCTNRKIAVSFASCKVLEIAFGADWSGVSIPDAHGFRTNATEFQLTASYALVEVTMHGHVWVDNQAFGRSFCRMPMNRQALYDKIQLVVEAPLKCTVDLIAGYGIERDPAKLPEKARLHTFAEDWDETKRTDWGDWPYIGFLIMVFTVSVVLGAMLAHTCGFYFIYLPMRGFDIGGNEAANSSLEVEPEPSTSSNDDKKLK